MRVRPCTVIIAALISPAVRSGHAAVSRSATWVRPHLVELPVIRRALAPAA